MSHLDVAALGRPIKGPSALGSDLRRMLHLSYTRRDLPQQLVQLDHLTQGLYDRLSPVHRYLMEIEPPGEGGVLRQPKRDHKGWWN